MLTNIAAHCFVQERVPELEKLRLRYDAARRKLEPLLGTSGGMEPAASSSKDLEKLHKTEEKFEREFVWVATRAAVSTCLPICCDLIHQ